MRVCVGPYSLEVGQSYGISCLRSVLSLRVCACASINQKFLYADAANFRTEWKWCVVRQWDSGATASSTVISASRWPLKRNVSILPLVLLSGPSLLPSAWQNSRKQISFSNIHTFSLAIVRSPTAVSSSTTLNIFSPFDICEFGAGESSMRQLLHYGRHNYSWRSHATSFHNLWAQINAKWAHFDFKMQLDFDIST